MVVKVIIKDTTITLNEILIWIKKRFFWNLFQSWFIMRNRFSNMSEKLSDNRPEPPGLNNHHASHISFKKWYSLKMMQFEVGFKMQMHSNPFKSIQNHSKSFKISGKIKENYFSRSCFILWKLQKTKKKHFFIFWRTHP